MQVLGKYMIIRYLDQWGKRSSMNANLLMIPTSPIHFAAGAFRSAMARARVDGPGEDRRGLNCSLLDPCGHHHFLGAPVCVDHLGALS